MRRQAWLLACCLLACDAGPYTLASERAASEVEPEPVPWFGGPRYYEEWPRGYPSDPSYFPIGVWMQSPANAERFAAVGVNHYVGLWQGPTTEQLTIARSANMPVVCEQAGVWQDNASDRNIWGWLQGDGPDNAQELEDGSYGPCIPPTETQARYAEMVSGDASRPVMLLLGQGVAMPDWAGRGECAGRTEDYLGYAASADILVNYTYPLANQHPIELVASGIQRLNEYASWKKPVFADIEASSIRGLPRPTPHELRAEVWMSLVHGAAGVQYFCHRMEPLNETDCLDDAETAAALTQINRELTELSPALNTQSYAIATESDNPAVPVRAVLKRVGAERYVFATGMADADTRAKFVLSDLPESTRVEVIGEGRYLSSSAARFEDHFAPYDVHLYRWTAP